MVGRLSLDVGLENDPERFLPLNFLLFKQTVQTLIRVSVNRYKAVVLPYFVRSVFFFFVC